MAKDSKKPAEKKPLPAGRQAPPTASKAPKKPAVKKEVVKKEPEKKPVAVAVRPEPPKAQASSTASAASMIAWPSLHSRATSPA